MLNTENSKALDIFALMRALEEAPNLWLTTTQVASITSLTPNWLAAAREGLKEHPGPPYKKIGNGRTAPIRYRAGDVMDWMNHFQSHLNTSGSKYSSHEDFMARAQPAERWLYSVNTERLERVPFLEAMATQVITPATKLSWLSHKDISASIWSLEVRLPVDLLRKLPIVGKGGINARVLEALLATYKD